MLGGFISDVGSPAYTGRGVVFSTSPNPTIETNVDGGIRMISVTGTGRFEFNVTGLIPGTMYYVRAFAYNGATPVYGEQVIFTTATVPEDAFIETFETGNGATLDGWTIVNGPPTQTNRWNVGTATASGGNRSIYITNAITLSLAAPNSYSAFNTSTVHFYRDFDIISTGENPAILSFDWRGGNWSGNKFLAVYLVQTTVTPVAGTLLTAQEQQHAVLRGTSGVLSWVRHEIPLPVISGNVRIVFTWRNPGGSESPPPAAVDNIVLTGVVD